jgi:hypothetical protein
MYEKKKLKKLLVINMVLVFVTVSMMNNVVGFVNNERDISNNDSNTDIQNNLNSENNYEIIWCGNASVDYHEWNIIDTNLVCEPDCEKNISIRGPDLYLIFLLGTNISLRYEPIIPSIKQARYEVFIEIDDGIRWDESYMRIIDTGVKSNILAIGYLLKNAVNRTVKIKIDVKVNSQKPNKDPVICTRTVILHIKGLQRSTENKVDNYEIIWAGNATVDYVGPFNINKNLFCDLDSEYNISILGPNLYLIFLLGTTVSMKYPPTFPLVRIAGYSMYIEIDGVPRSDTGRMKIIEPGSKSNILGAGFLLKNACNKIVKITLQPKVYSIIPIRLPETCERTIILHINCI